jgi:hypothetical protein
MPPARTPPPPAPGLDAASRDAGTWLFRFHAGTESVTAAGIVDIGRGSAPAARLAGWLMGLPSGGAGQPARVRVERHRAGMVTRERWTRTFGAVTLVTRQTRVGDRVTERAGPVELRMRCRVTANGAWYAPEGAALVLGRLRLPLPGPLALQARARAWPSGDAAFSVAVSVRVPLLGALLSYRGSFTEVTR